MTEATDINATLAQRGSAYGDFREQGRITQNLKRAMHDSPNWAWLPSYMKEGLDMIQHKISRMLNGDAFYDDNMHDMIGYTKLMQDRAKQDRDAGMKWNHGGDKLYPPFEMESVTPPKISLDLAAVMGADRVRAAMGMPPIKENIPAVPAERPYEDRLAEALETLEDLGFKVNGDGDFVNDEQDTPYSVLVDYLREMTVGIENAPGSGKPIRTRSIVEDPVQSYYELKRRGAIK